MPWTITNWANVDWSAAATLNEFVDAFNERNSAAGGAGGAFAAINVGDDVQDHELFLSFQRYFSPGVCQSFVVSHAGGEALGAGYYDGRSSIPRYADLAAAFSAAGLGYEDWRRYTTHPDDGGEVAYGEMRAGDIIGPWIFEDIQKCLNVLVWTGAIASVYEGDRYDGYGLAATEAGAKAAAEADWAYGDASGSSMDVYSKLTTSGANYVAYLWRTDAVYSAQVWNGLTRHADWYIKTHAYAEGDMIFDAYGDDVLKDLYSLWSQDEPATNDTTIVSQTKLGDAPTMPNNPWGGLYAGKRGWYNSAGGIAVVRWNVVGGFAYD